LNNKMVEPTFLVGLAVVFLFILVIILRSSSSDSVEKKEKIKKQPAVKEKKQNKGPKRNSLKKDKRPAEVKEWTGIDTAARDAQEMLEFLKGKDPAELAKHQNNQTKQQDKKKLQGKKAKSEESQSSEDSANEVVNEEGFSVITNKKPKSPNEKKKKPKKDGEKKEKGDKKNQSKVFYKDDADKTEQKNENKKNRSQRKPRSEGENADAGTERRKKPEGEEQPKRERKERSDGEKRERKERPEGERRERKRERSEGEEGERPKRQQQQRKAPPTVPPNVKYEQADLDDILNSITQDYKPKPKVHRVASVFSKIPRNIILTIFSKLEARNLLALSEVNHYFIVITRTDFLWKDLLLEDFAVRDLGKYRNFRAAYRGEYKKRKLAAKKKKAQEVKDIPQDDAKDTEKPTESKGKKERKPANEEGAAEQPAPTKEQEKTEDQ